MTETFYALKYVFVVALRPWAALSSSMWLLGSGQSEPLWQEQQALLVPPWTGGGCAWGVLTDCWLCLDSPEHRGPPSGTNSARQSPAPQHRPLALAQINSSSIDRYRALGCAEETHNSPKSLSRGLLMQAGDIHVLPPVYRGATEGEAGKEASSSYRLSWPEHKHLAQSDAGLAAAVGSRHPQVWVRGMGLCRAAECSDIAREGCKAEQPNVVL